MCDRWYFLPEESPSTTRESAC